MTLFDLSELTRPGSSPEPFTPGTHHDPAATPAPDAPEPVYGEASERRREGARGRGPHQQASQEDVRGEVGRRAHRGLGPRASQCREPAEDGRLAGGASPHEASPAIGPRQRRAAHPRHCVERPLPGRGGSQPRSAGSPTRRLVGAPARTTRAIYACRTACAWCPSGCWTPSSCTKWHT